MATTFRGRPACSCLAAWLPVYERELKRRGLIVRSIDIYQLIGTAAASGPTHTKGGAYDIVQRSTEAILVAREMGAAAWSRSGSAWEPEHQHGVLNGCPHNGPARYQVTALQEHHANGLGTGGTGGDDDGPDVDLPLRSWRDGVRWARRQGRSRAIAGRLLVPRIEYVVDVPGGTTTFAGPGKDYGELHHRPRGYTFTAKFATGNYRRRAAPKEWFPAEALDRVKGG